MMGAAFVFAVGAMTLPLLAFLVINQEWSLSIEILGIRYKPWRLFLIICGIPGFLCGLSMFALPESPKFLLSIGKELEAIKILQKIYSWNGGSGKLEVNFNRQSVNPNIRAPFRLKDFF